MKALTLIVAAVLVVGSQACLEGYVELEGICFNFHQSESMPWDDAKLFCEGEGAVLAKIAAGETLKAVYNYINTYGLDGSFWLGASDFNFEGDWTWVADGSRVDKGTPYWAIHNGLFGWDHEPSGGSDENCLLLDSSRKHYFNDANCFLIHHPLCMM